MAAKKSNKYRKKYPKKVATNRQQSQRTAPQQQTAAKAVGQGFAKYAEKFKYPMLVAIMVITLIAYWPSLFNDFTNWDDSSYASQNYGLENTGWSGIKSQFRSYHMGNYHPLTMLSLAIDFNLAKKRPANDPDAKRDYEPEPFMFHLHNLILHLLNTLLVWLFVYMLFGQATKRNAFPAVWPRAAISLLAALFFGISTMHVESVAWVSERKDVLYTYYFVLSLILYLKYLDSKKLIWIVLSILAFVFSALSKGQAVSLAVSLIAIDWFLGRKLVSPKLIFEKVPFFLLALLFGIVAIKAQQSGDAIHNIAEYFFHERIVFASYGFLQYLLKLTIPFDLAAIYPYPYKSGNLPAIYYLYILPALAVLYGVYRLYQKNKAAAFGMFFYMINIFLLLQFLPVGSAVMADRYSYIPSIGVFIVQAVAVLWLLTHYQKLKYGIGLTLLIYTGFLTYSTFEQSKVWRDSLSLWNHTLKLEEKAVVAWNNRGSTYEKMKMHDEAIADFNEAISLKPDYTHAYYNRGTSQKELGMKTTDPQQREKLIQKALDDFDKAILLDRGFSEAYHNKGITLDYIGLRQEALESFDKAIEIAPRKHEPYINRGVAKGKSGDIEGAIADFNKSLELRPNNPSAYSNRGLAKDLGNDYEGAIADYNKAISLNPEFITAYSNRALVKKKQEDFQGALQDFAVAIQLDPGFADGYFQRGVIFYQLEQLQQACAEWQQAAQLGHQNAAAYLQQFCE